MKSIVFGIIITTLSGLIIFYFYPEIPLPAHCRIDRLVVMKSERVMYVYTGHTLLKTYHVSVGKNAGDKVREGDKRTPEGVYLITSKNPGSGYHKNLGISYPDKQDIAEAKTRHVSPGGDVKIHGLKNGRGYVGKFHLIFNWTAGCIAVTDEEMDELYDHVAIGAVIEIHP